jgi:tRNA nucleotidyltransferase (CCA-adding enzyme)
MRSMVAAGEADHLVAERVWQELAKGLMESRPSRMFEVLRDCGALARILPELNRLWGVSQSAFEHPEVDAGVHAMMVIDLAAREQAPLAVRFAALMHDLGKGEVVQSADGGGPDTALFSGHEKRSQQLVDALCARLRIPGEVRDIARLTAREHGLIHKAAQLPAAALVQLLERLDALRRPARLELVLAACSADWRGRLGMAERDYLPTGRLKLAQQAARSVDAGSLATIGGHPDEIRARIHQHRVAAVDAVLTT